LAETFQPTPSGKWKRLEEFPRRFATQRARDHLAFNCQRTMTL